jgi:hypothetical protein
VEGPHAYERAVVEVLAIEGQDDLLLSTVARNQLADDKAKAFGIYLNAKLSL